MHGVVDAVTSIAEESESARNETRWEACARTAGMPVRFPEEVYLGRCVMAITMQDCIMYCSQGSQGKAKTYMREVWTLGISFSRFSASVYSRGSPKMICVLEVEDLFLEWSLDVDTAHLEHCLVCECVDDRCNVYKWR